MSNHVLSESVQRLIGELQAEIVARDEEIYRLKRKNNNSKKLTESDVKRIRQWWAKGVYTTQKALADDFEVNPATISRILDGYYW